MYNLNKVTSIFPDLTEVQNAKSHGCVFLLWESYGISYATMQELMSAHNAQQFEVIKVGVH